ncbi:MAG: hypothetical protein ACFFAN_01540 [Promethearchaeota archaeon]
MGSIELFKKNFQQLLVLILRLKEYIKVDIKKMQKCKFFLISLLVSKLFKYKNSKESYINISSLIILCSTIFEEGYPIDIYSGYKEEGNFMDVKLDYRKILKQEFNNTF